MSETGVPSDPKVLSPLPLFYLIVCGLLLAVYYLVPNGGGSDAEWKVALYCLVSASSAGAIFVGIRRNRPTRPMAWYFVLVNQVIYALADVTFYVRHDLLNQTQYPSVSDVLYLLHYPFLIAAVVIFIHRRNPGSDRSAVIDAGVLAVTTAMLSWIFVIAPSFDSPGQEVLSRITSAAYPIMDATMLVMGMWLFVGSGKRTRSFWTLALALVLLFATDTTYALQQFAGTYRPGGFLDGMWAVYYLLIGASALDPSMVHLDEPSRVSGQLPVAWRFFGLAIAAIAIPVVLLVEQDRDMLSVLPAIAAGTALLFALVILRLAGMVSEQRHMAITDLLTGLRNRRYFEAHYAIDCARAARSGQPLSLALIDIDLFKSVNDSYGHAAGDRVLCEIADRLRRGVRAGDVLARYGGEEFAVLFADAGLDEARSASERLRTAINSQPVEIADGVEVAVTVSTGVVTYPDHVSVPTDLAVAADRALYAAKSAGRNRLVVGKFDPPAAVMRHGTPDAVVQYLETLADRVDLYQAPMEHGSAIARWTVAIANELGLDESAQRRCDLAARLHDVGKVAVPMHILMKTDPLTREDWQFIRDHPAQGELLLSVAPGMREVAEIVGQHHERVDGTGYPKGLRGEELHIEAKILSVCDTFASMRADRPYRPGLSEEEACSRLVAARGTQLCASLVDLFLALLARGVVGHLGQLENCYAAIDTPARPDGVAPCE